jgi:hypothetical protein
MRDRTATERSKGTNARRVSPVKGGVAPAGVMVRLSRARRRATAVQGDTLFAPPPPATANATATASSETGVIHSYNSAIARSEEHSADAAATRFLFVPFVIFLSPKPFRCHCPRTTGGATWWEKTRLAMSSSCANTNRRPIGRLGSIFGSSTNHAFRGDVQ